MKVNVNDWDLYENETETFNGFVKNKKVKRPNEMKKDKSKKFNKPKRFKKESEE